MNVLIAAVVVASPMILAIDAVAQTNYPEHQIRLVAGFPPGAQSDTVARLLGQKLAEAWGKPVVIDNLRAPPAISQQTELSKQHPMGTRWDYWARRRWSSIRASTS